MYRDSLTSITPWYEFDEDETRILNLSWSTVGSDRSDMEDLGVRIYSMIFNQCPEARRLFPFMKFNGKEQNTRAFQFQALRFIQVLESAIKNLDNLSNLDSILDNLGRRHGKLESSSGFRKCYWTTFLECAIFHLRVTMEKPRKKTQLMTSDEIDEAIVLWRILLRAVIDRIEVGYEKDILNRSTSIETSSNENKRAPKLSEYSRTSSIATSKSDSIHEMMSSLNPFKNRKNSNEK